MNYWLHRITGGENAWPLSVGLFKKGYGSEQGYISIGWSDFATEEYLSMIAQEWKDLTWLWMSRVMVVRETDGTYGASSMRWKKGILWLSLSLTRSLYAG